MPLIITQVEGGEHREAFATLQAVWSWLQGQPWTPESGFTAHVLPRSRPLADGKIARITLRDEDVVLDVELTTWPELAAAVMAPSTWWDPDDVEARGDVLRRWNAEHGIGVEVAP